MTRRQLLLVLALVAVVAVAAAGLGYLYLKHQRAEAACEVITDLEVDYAADRQQALKGPGKAIAFVGDSYTEGQHIDSPLHAYAYVTADELGLRPYVDGRGGSGFINDGPCGHDRLEDRIPDADDVDPAILVLQAGINDLGSSDLTDATAAAIRVAARTVPGATIVVLGSFSPTGVDLQDVRAANEGIAAGAEAEGVQFIDPAEWEFDELPDRIHPSVQGHREIGEALAAALQ